MDASILEHLQKKIQKLQLEKFQLQDQLLSRPLDQYKLKYEMLLAKIAQEGEINKSRISSEENNQAKTIQQTNQKWEKLLSEKNDELMATIQSLQQDNKNLSIKNTELELKIVRFQRQLDEGDTQVFKFRCETLKKENQRIRKQLRDTIESHERKIDLARQEEEIRVQGIKERQKISYRDQIVGLEEKIISLGFQLEEANRKASPDRQANIEEEKKEISRQKEQMSKQIFKLSQVLRKRDRQILDLKFEDQRNNSQHAKTVKQLSDQLKEYERQLYNRDSERQVELGNLQRQMGQKRQLQANDLKQQLKRHEQAFQRQRFEWKHIIDQFESQSKKVKKDWNDDKEKFKEQKKKLNDKISDLRQRLRQKEQQLANKEDARMLHKLQQMDEDSQNFATYESGITFMDRQVRKSAIKIQQKDTEINALIKELQLTQQQAEKDMMQTREKARAQIRQLYDKNFKLEDEYDRIYLELRQQQKFNKRKEKELLVERNAHNMQIESFNAIIEEMQRDYDRLTSNKKSLEDSFREERENVITGKLDVNQERKKKWDELNKQKREIELLYRQKISRIEAEHEVDMDKMRRQKHELASQNEQLRGQIDGIKKRLGASDAEKENKYTEYQAKLATLDLEIALTQNLFQSLSQAVAKGGSPIRKQLEQIDQEASKSASGSEKLFARNTNFDGDVTNQHYHSTQMPQKMQQFPSVAFSFCPPGQYPQNKK